MKGEKNVGWQPETQPKGKPPAEKTKGAETMKKLIDAEALKLSHCKECTLYPDKCMGKDCDCGAIIHINKMPTIDAVPVSFIQELIEKYNQFIEAYGGIQECETIVDGLIKRVVNYEVLIERWREKNGTETD